MSLNRHEQRRAARNSAKNKIRSPKRQAPEDVRAYSRTAQRINTIAAVTYLFISSISIGIAGNRLVFGDRDDARGKEMAVDDALRAEREKGYKKEEERNEYWRKEFREIREMREELGRDRAILDMRSATLSRVTSGYSEAKIDYSNAMLEARIIRAKETRKQDERVRSMIFDVGISGDNYIIEATPIQTEQLRLLRAYIACVMNYDIPNYLFVFGGKDAKGMNIGRNGIGLHEAMFDVSFGEALEVLVHEITHNIRHGHDTFFSITQGKIHTHIHEVLRNNLEFVQGGGMLDERKRIMIEAPGIWDALRECGANDTSKNDAQTKLNEGLEDCPSADFSGGVRVTSH